MVKNILVIMKYLFTIINEIELWVMLYPHHRTLP